MSDYVASRIRPAVVLGGIGVGTILGLSVVMGSRANGTLTAIGVALAIPALWLVWRPERLIVAYCFALPFEVYLSTSLRLTTSQVLQIGAVGLWVLHRLFATALGQRGSRPARAAMVSFALLVLASLGWSADPAVASRGALRLVGAICMFAVVTSAATSWNRIVTMVRALCLGALASALYGLAQYWRGGYDALYPFFSPFYAEPWLARGGAFSVVGTFSNPNIFAAFCASILPLAMTVPLGTRHQKTARLMLVAVLSVAVVLSYSKTAWALTALLWGLWLIPRRSAGRGLALLVLILASFLVLGQAARIRTALEGAFPNTQDASVSPRFLLWGLAFEAASERPLFGFGPMGFAGATARERGRLGLQDLERTHNIYLQVLVDHGAVGFALFFGAILALVGATLEAQRREPTGQSQRIRWGLTGGVAVFLLFGVVDSLNASNNYVGLVFVLLGLLEASLQLGTPAPLPPPSLGELA